MVTQEKQFEQKELQIFIHQGYFVLNQQTINQDIGCLLIKRYIRTEFVEFVNLIRADSLYRTFNYLNFQI